MQKIFISEQLKEALQEIESSSSIAKALLAGADGYQVHTHIDQPIVNYLSISETDKTKISYLTHNRICDNPWHSHKRIFGRPGSVVNKVFRDLKDRDIEVFNNLYRSVLSRIKFTFNIVSGEELKKYYHADIYQNHSGSLGASCMKYNNCQKYMDLYTSNPETISMLIMLDDNGLLLGRALLWKFNSGGTTNLVMDRIYTINDEELVFHFKRWGSTNGYMCKHEQRWNNSLQFELNSKRFSQNFDIQLTKWKFDRYPYLDTFKFFDTEKGTLQNYISPNIKKTLCAADGSQFSPDHLALDFTTNVHYYHGDTVTIKYLDGKFLERQSELRTHAPNAEWSRVNDMYILKKDCYFLEEIDDFIFKKEFGLLNNTDEIDRIRLEKLKKNREIISNQDRKISEQRGVLQELLECAGEPNSNERMQEILNQYFSHTIGTRSRRRPLQRVRSSFRPDEMNAQASTPRNVIQEEPVSALTTVEEWLSQSQQLSEPAVASISPTSPDPTCEERYWFSDTWGDPIG